MQSKKKSIYYPVKEQLRLVIEYIDILEYKQCTIPVESDVALLLQFLDYAKRQCEVYLNYEVLKRKDGDRSYKVPENSEKQIDRPRRCKTAKVGRNN